MIENWVLVHRRHWCATVIASSRLLFACYHLELGDLDITLYFLEWCVVPAPVETQIIGFLLT